MPKNDYAMVKRERSTDDPFARRWHSSCALIRTMNLQRLTIYAICGLLLAGRLIAGVEWHVIKVNGRDFLSVDNISKFYGFPNPTINGKNVDLNNGKHEMQFHLDSL